MIGGNMIVSKKSLRLFEMSSVNTQIFTLFLRYFVNVNKIVKFVNAYR